ncbi:hypothetical protein FPZ54_06680 [Sphingomonas suaedae]|uniref:Uncharacterized protein n=1 Tax=Sphingomonas suaedae TaxID=2599297 RepID=A0A518RE85_9SPHN|nr:hypothetical protein [Sphingomonas suaedae]QDX25734.1 hypothetical protein FPZ54_06680 [Sphingomonas suaedae]
MSVAALAVAAAPNGALTQNRPASVADVSIPLSDARNIEPNSVRFSAAQFTRSGPAVVLFGVTKANWPKLKAAIQQAVYDGYRVQAVFIGPANVQPAIEIYAKGQHVTVNGINPNTISGAELTRLIRDINREYYG